MQQLGRFFTRGVSALSQALQLPEDASGWNTAGSGGKQASADAGNDAVQLFWKQLRSIGWCPVRSKPGN